MNGTPDPDAAPDPHRDPAVRAGRRLDTATVGGTWSVGQLARLAGVTVRTLHHYDRLGLLVPGGRSRAGYREYTRDDLLRLQRVLAYRELGLALDDVRRLLDEPGADVVARLRAQHALVVERIERLREVAAVLEKTMEARAMGIDLTPQEMFEVFGEEDPARHAAEAEQRWGDTEAWRQSQGRAAGYSKDDWLRMKEQLTAVERAFVEAMAAGLPADSPAALRAAEAHRQHICTWFYDCGYDLHVGLAEMYLADPRFTRHYEDIAPGLAQYVHDAVLANAVGRV